MAKALELRPGSTVQNISLPTRNVSPVYIEGRNRFDWTLVEIGLPER